MKKLLVGFRELYINRKLRALEKKIRVDPKNRLLVFSDPRGGSTWLAELLRSIPKSATIWEPLNIAADSPFRRMGFGWRQPIPQNEVWPEARMCFEDLFRGKGLTKTTVFNELNNLKAYQEASYLIFKFVNGNALLPWLVENFHFECKPIYLIRHPYAVVASQIKHGGWSHLKERFKIPPMRFNSHYEDHKPFLASLKTHPEINLAHWCLTNLETLRNPDNNRKWITINYENLVMNTEHEIDRIFKIWNKEIPHGIRTLYHQPSKTVRGNSPIIGNAQISHWQKTLDEKTKVKMARVLDYFKVEFYSSQNPCPEISFGE